MDNDEKYRNCPVCKKRLKKRSDVPDYRPCTSCRAVDRRREKNLGSPRKCIQFELIEGGCKDCAFFINQFCIREDKSECMAGKLGHWAERGRK